MKTTPAEWFRKLGAWIRLEILLNDIAGYERDLRSIAKQRANDVEAEAMIKGQLKLAVARLESDEFAALPGCAKETS